jgi:hypothetical protein
MSPVHLQQQSHRSGSAHDTNSHQMDMDQILTPSHSPTVPFVPSYPDQHNYPHISPYQASTSSSPSFLPPSYQGHSSAALACPNCLQDRSPEDTSCWRCLTAFTSPTESDVSSPEPTETQELWSAAQTNTIRIKQEPDLQTNTPLHQPNPLFAQHPANPHVARPQQPQPNQSTYNLLQLQWAQQQQQYLQQAKEARRIQQLHRGLPYMQTGIGSGTSSNPINIIDSPPQTRNPQSNTHIPTFSLPQSLAPLNNGWPVNIPNPFAGPSTSNDPAQYLSRIAYDYAVPNPSADEIKELLSNIRPDEEIKVEDKDAIIPGMAGHMRLMKHQQMGLAWMQKMEDGKNKGGLLADEMGLGKTIQRYVNLTE